VTSELESCGPTYIIASVQIWDEKALEQLAEVPGIWRTCHTPNELSLILSECDPTYIFFLHWRWIVPENIVESIECVCFHMTDLPFGRGGSPLQNLISRGIYQTQLTSLRMVKDLDAGPIYFKHPLALKGTAADIYRSAEGLSLLLIAKIIALKPIPIPQTGTPVIFKRRTPDQSELPAGLSGEKLYDFIRMLDAPGYPKAFCFNNSLKLEFSDANLTESGLVTAHVEFSLIGCADNEQRIKPT
jgi:methionyl-tRNA formyltransferase